jgi:hypothetical protein
MFLYKFYVPVEFPYLRHPELVNMCKRAKQCHSMVTYYAAIYQSGTIAPVTIAQVSSNIVINAWRKRLEFISIYRRYARAKFETLK